MRLLDTVATLMHQRSLARPPQWFLDAVSPGKALSGVSVTETTALNSAAVWAACNALANPVAILPRHVYKRIEGTGRERAIEHPAYATINSRPNAEMTAFAFFHSSMLDLQEFGGSDGDGPVGGGQPPQRLRLRRKGN